LKEELRFKKLNFSQEDLFNCKDNFLSASLLNKLKLHTKVSLGLLYVLILVFLTILLFSISQKLQIEKEIDAGIYLYYFLILASISVIALFVWGIVKKHKILSSIALEKIQSIDASFENISYGVRARAPYLKVENIEFGSIYPIQNLIEIFDKKRNYRFYYSSKSRILLAVDELQN